MRLLLPLALLLIVTPALAQPARVIVRLHAPADAGRLAAGPAAFFATADAASWRPLVPPSARPDVQARRAAFGLDRTLVVTLHEGARADAAAAAIAGQADVAFAEADAVGHAGGRAVEIATPVAAALPAAVATPGVTPDDPLFSRQWSFHNTGSNLAIPPLRAGADVSAPEAWSVTTGSASTILAILDSGVRLTHPEVAGRLWTNPGETPGNGVDDDGNGYVDDVHGWDFVNDDALPADDNGHGANVTGIAAGTGDNATGYAGLDWQARVMTLKIFNAQLSGFYADWIAALVYAADHGARVANLSGGGTTPSQTLADGVGYAHAAGVVVTASMMNTNDAVVYVPAAYETAIGVGATGGQDQRAVPFCWGGGSVWGPHIDLVAPGDYIYQMTHTSDTNYNVYWCGTSMAAPHVAGAASLLLAVEPTLTPAQVRERLMATADDGVGPANEDTPGFDVYFGAGRLNVARLLGVIVAGEAAPTAGVSLAVGPTPTADDAVATLRLDAPTAQVRVEVVDALGRRVAVLHDGPLGAGTHRLGVEAGRLPAGVYRVRAVAGAAALSHALVVAR